LREGRGTEDRSLSSLERERGTALRTSVEALPTDRRAADAAGALERFQGLQRRLEFTARRGRTQERAHNPLLLAADFDQTDVPIPWLGGKHLRFAFGQQSRLS